MKQQETEKHLCLQWREETWAGDGCRALSRPKSLRRIKAPSEQSAEPHHETHGRLAVVPKISTLDRRPVWAARIILPRKPRVEHSLARFGVGEGGTKQLRVVG